MRTLLLFGLLCLASPASAQDGAETMTDDVDDEEARRLFDTGRASYEAGRYEEALALFRRSHELSGRAGLHWNIAQCLDRLRRDQEALESYDQFRRELPNHERRAQTDARIAVLRRQLATAGERTSDYDATTRESSGGHSLAEEWWFWLIIGVAVAGGAIAIGLVVANENTSPQAPLPGTNGAVAVALVSW